MSKTEENLGEELYMLLAETLNRRVNRAVQDSMRGEYGTLHYLTYIKDGESAGELSKYLHIVPGRMTDILSSLEYKNYIKRERDKEDRRRVVVYITEEGLSEEKKRRAEIRKEYQGLLKKLGKKDTLELIRLLKILLSYDSEE
ncbi:MAG: MarR family winged helix-turn-helix transcriptional regulator [Lachnospiraceae bacterium]|nr:MarR family winged helix-turn-helix transcriptional regulator [Lachnospiraceae bacterium]